MRIAKIYKSTFLKPTRIFPAQRILEWALENLSINGRLLRNTFPPKALIPVFGQHRKINIPIPPFVTKKKLQT